MKKGVERMDGRFAFDSRMLLLYTCQLQQNLYECMNTYLKRNQPGMCGGDSSLQSVFWAD